MIQQPVLTLPAREAQESLQRSHVIIFILRVEGPSDAVVDGFGSFDREVEADLGEALVEAVDDGCTLIRGEREEEFSRAESGLGSWRASSGSLMGTTRGHVLPSPTPSNCQVTRFLLRSSVDFI